MEINKLISELEDCIFLYLNPYNLGDDGKTTKLIKESIKKLKSFEKLEPGYDDNNKILDKYLEAKKELYDYFFFKEDWTVFPIDDRCEYWWYINGGQLFYFDSKEAYENNDYMHTYSDEIIYSRMYPKSIYEGDEFTMIMVDTHTDGNKFLAIYDNSKKLQK